MAGMGWQVSMAKKPDLRAAPKIDVGTYLLAQRSGLFRPGQSLMLAATLPAKAKPKPTKGKRK